MKRHTDDDQRLLAALLDAPTQPAKRSALQEYLHLRFVQELEAEMQEPPAPIAVWRVPERRFARSA